MTTPQGSDPLNEKATQLKRWLVSKADEVKTRTRPHRRRLLSEVEKQLSKTQAWVASAANRLADPSETVEKPEVEKLSEAEQARLEAEAEAELSDTLRWLVARSTRTHPEAIVIGEVSEGSAFDLLQALDQANELPDVLTPGLHIITVEDGDESTLFAPTGIPEDSQETFFTEDAEVKPLQHSDTTPGLFDDLTVRVVAADMHEKAAAEEQEEKPAAELTAEERAAIDAWVEEQNDETISPPPVTILPEREGSEEPGKEEAREHTSAEEQGEKVEELITLTPTLTTVEELFEKLADDFVGTTPVVLLTGKAKTKLDALVKLAVASQWRVKRPAPEATQRTLHLFAHSFRDSPLGFHGPQLVAIDARTFTPEEVELALRPLLSLPASELVRVAVVLAPGAQVSLALASALAVKF